MAKEILKNNLSVCEQIKQMDESGNEFWMARQLSKVLDYTDFRKFSSVIAKAAEACKNSGHNPLDHLVEANEVISAGKGAAQTYPSYKLSRYASYLIVQNTDTSKEVVALGQTYFAVGIHKKKNLKKNQQILSTRWEAQSLPPTCLEPCKPKKNYATKT